MFFDFTLVQISIVDIVYVKSPLAHGLPQVLVPNLINYQPKSEQRKAALIVESCRPKHLILSCGL